MVNVLKYSLSILCALLSVRSSAQAPLTYQVLATEHSYVGDLAVSQFDNLLPGDTVLVGSSGHLALISNYFHALEIDQDSVFVLPDLGVEDLGAAYKRPDLRDLFSGQRIEGNEWMGGVEHATYFMDLFFPLKTHTILPGQTTAIPIVWNDNRSEEEKEGVIVVKIKDMFDEDIAEFRMEADPTCLDLSTYPKMDEILGQDGFVIVSFEQQYLNGREFAIKLPKSKSWNAPFASCEIPNAASAVALAMFLEYNHGYFKDRNTSYYYALAAQLSSHPQYAKLNEWYKSRKGRVGR